jgi:hypothetical protein
MLVRRAMIETPCRVCVEQTPEHFHAHVELDGDIAIGPGDRVRVHGAPISIAFGQRAEFSRIATVEFAGPLRRAWTLLRARFELAELYEISFSPRSFL